MLVKKLSLLNAGKQKRHLDTAIEQVQVCFLKKNGSAKSGELHLKVEVPEGLEKKDNYYLFSNAIFSVPPITYAQKCT